MVAVVMRAPDKLSPADIDILVADMVKELGGGALVQQDVRNVMAVLPVQDEPTWGNRARNLKYMKILRTQIEKLQATLRSEPASSTYFMLFAPEEGEFDAMRQEAVTRQSHLTMILEELRARCDANIAAAPGAHGSFGWRERQAAIEARLLWERHGKRPTLIETFIVFAEWLFEAAWNKKPQDMKRACDQALHSPIKTD